MWRLIDNEMKLKECSIYIYAPEEDPYDGEEGSLWSLNYFFFNKTKKRVCYLYLRSLSILGNSPAPKTPSRAAKRPASGIWSMDEETSKKRARYWLGDKASDAEWAGAEEEEEKGVSGQWDEEGLEEAEVLDDGDEPITIPSDTDSSGNSPCKGRSRFESVEVSSDNDDGKGKADKALAVRSVSEDIAASMDP